MIISKMKNIYGFGVCVFLGVALGFAWWYFSKYENFNVKPVKEPALEVSEGQVIVNKDKYFYHIVKEGETLSEIAERYQIDVDTLLGANEELSEVINPGQRLVILPKKGVLYKVEQGDSLWQIARLFEVELETILQENQRKSDFLEQGESLFIPGVKPLQKSFNSVSVSRMSDAKFILPATGEISSPFGWRWGRLHEGIDIADDAGTTIVAALSGRVIYAGWISGYGYSVILEHLNGYSTLYGHMQNILTNNGAIVRQGQTIGEMGSTGNSTGPHVHFEVRKNGELINPVNVLR